MPRRKTTNNKENTPQVLPTDTIKLLQMIYQELVKRQDKIEDILKFIELKLNFVMSGINSQDANQMKAIQENGVDVLVPKTLLDVWNGKFEKPSNEV